MSLFLISVAESGERKSRCDQLALEGVRRFERSRLDSYGAAFTAYQTAAAIHEANSRSILAARQDASAQQADLEALGPEPRCPAAPELLLTDPTMEGLLKHYETSQPSVAIFSDEGGQFLGGYGMTADNRVKTGTVLSKLWGGDSINRARGDIAAAPPVRSASLPAKEFSLLLAGRAKQRPGPVAMLPAKAAGDITLSRICKANVHRRVQLTLHCG